MFYTTISSTSYGSVSEGVQQTYEISELTSIEDTKDISLSYSIYPNPTTDFLTIKIKNLDNENLSYWLYVESGNLIETKKIKAEETQISMTIRSSGIYILRITVGNKVVKAFKIIKN